MSLIEPVVEPTVNQQPIIPKMPNCTSKEIPVKKLEDYVASKLQNDREELRQEYQVC